MEHPEGCGPHLDLQLTADSAHLCPQPVAPNQPVCDLSVASRGRLSEWGEDCTFYLFVTVQKENLQLKEKMIS